jgi:hypothetical protein
MKTNIPARRFVILLATAAIGLALGNRAFADDHKKKHHHHHEDKDKKQEVVKLVAAVGQSTVTVKNGNAILCTVKSGLPNVEAYRFIDDKFIAVKSRGNHGPALVELFEVQTGILRDKVMAFAVQNDQDWAIWAKE